MRYFTLNVNCVEDYKPNKESIPCDYRTDEHELYKVSMNFGRDICDVRLCCSFSKILKSKRILTGNGILLWFSLSEKAYAYTVHLACKQPILHIKSKVTFFSMIRYD